MPETIELELTINDRPRSLRIEPRETLGDVLRDRLGLTGTKISCDAQVCGACTVLVDGLAVSACTYLAVDADDHAVRTIEGLSDDGRLSPLQQAFIDHAGFQCGFCTPGMVMAATALLEENPDPDREAVIHALEGNICRCTGYAQIIDAVLAAAASGDRPATATEPATGSTDQREAPPAGTSTVEPTGSPR